MDKKRSCIGRMAGYAVCFLLVCFYLVALWLGQNPKVCREYRMYYITNELMDWPGFGRLPYTFGQMEVFAPRWYGQKTNAKIAARRGQGWDLKVKDSGTWTHKETAFLYYEFDAVSVERLEVLQEKASVNEAGAMATVKGAGANGTDAAMVHYSVNVADVTEWGSAKVYINGYEAGTIVQRTGAYTFEVPVAVLLAPDADQEKNRVTEDGLVSVRFEMLDGGGFELKSAGFFQ